MKKNFKIVAHKMRKKGSKNEATNRFYMFEI